MTATRLRLTAAPARGVSARHASLTPFPFKPAQNSPKIPPKNPQKWGVGLDFSVGDVV